MKKSFIAVCFAVSFVPYCASAQYYSQQYYNPQYYGQQYYGGYANGAVAQGNVAQGNVASGYSQNFDLKQVPHTEYNTKQGKERTIGPISVGADYVYGSASYASKDFDVPSALTSGADYKGNTRGFKRSFNSVSFNLGFRPFKHIGVEAFYGRSLPKKTVAGVESYSYYPEFARDEYEVSYTSYGIDLLGYIPINDYVEFIATVGVGKYDIEAKVKVTAYEDTSYTKLKSSSLKMEDSVWAYRIGGGFQFWMSNHLAFRLMGRWTNVNGELLNYITEVNAGVRYHF